MIDLIPQTHNGTPFNKLHRCYIDFEYNGTTEQRFNLVCVAFRFEARGEVDEASLWLHCDDIAKQKLKELLISMREDTQFIAFNVVAEASCFVSLGLDPTKFCWLDLQHEWKMLINHNHTYMYGKHLIKGKKRITKAPKSKYLQTEEERLASDNSKPPKNLAGAVFKMLDKEVDTSHKNEMRDLIISAPDEFTPDQQQQILDYCMTDVDVLSPLRTAIGQAYMKHKAHRRGDITLADMALRGKTGARTALMTRIGYPVAPKKVRNFSNSVGKILEDICSDINAQFPDTKLFEWNKSRGAYSMKRQPQYDFIESSPYKDKWMKTNADQYSLSLDAWAKFYSFRHDYPQGNFPAQILRYLKTKQNLNGFMPAGTQKRETFFDSYGSDGRARAWLNPYGSQSSRYQPKATGFIPLKSAWMRSLIEPPDGYCIVGIDYSSEEFLLSALLSGDEAMFKSYASGDPYLGFAKEAKAVPEEGTRVTHAEQRDLFKATVLGISYLMAKYGLAGKITEDTGKLCSPEEAEKLINTFFEVYSDYATFIERTLYEYSKNGYLRLPDGWLMFGDNSNHRSVSNCPIQGMGACILRKAIELAQDRGIKVIIPLHDALYAQIKYGDWGQIDLLADCMIEAFRFYFMNDPVAYERSKAIRIDIDVWGPGLTEGEKQTPKKRKVKTQKVYIDPRAKSEYERFSKYF